MDLYCLAKSKIKKYSVCALSRFKILKVEVVSTLGSGDSVNTGIAFLLAQGGSLPEDFLFGLACGSANAQTAMLGMIEQAVVENLVSKIIISDIS